MHMVVVCHGVVCDMAWCECGVMWRVVVWCCFIIITLRMIGICFYLYWGVYLLVQNNDNVSNGK